MDATAAASIGGVESSSKEPSEVVPREESRGPAAKQYPNKYQAPVRELDPEHQDDTSTDGGVPKAKKSMDSLFDIPNGIGKLFDVITVHKCWDLHHQITFALRNWIALSVI